MLRATGAAAKSTVAPAARYWVGKAGPAHYAEHLPRLEAWVEGLARRQSYAAAAAVGIRND